MKLPKPARRYFSQGIKLIRQKVIQPARLPATPLAWEIDGAAKAISDRYGYVAFSPRWENFLRRLIFVLMRSQIRVSRGTFFKCLFRKPRLWDKP